MPNLPQSQEDYVEGLPNQYPAQFIVPGWIEIYDGRDIDDRDVVRPDNLKWAWGSDEHEKWARMSTAACPTYGSCTYCFRGGPVGKLCTECMGGPVKQRYYVLRTYNERDRYTLDSLTLAGVLGRTHEVAKANRKIDWLQTPTMSGNSDCMTLAIGRECNNMDDPVAKARQIRITQRRVWEFMEGFDEAHEPL